MLLTAFLLLAAILVIPPIPYYLWMKSKACVEWDFERSKDFRPMVTLVIATYNEAAVIKRKLENVQNLNYPDDKLQVIVIDSNSPDETLKVCEDFLATQIFRFPIRLISEEGRFGKSHALNTALKFAEGEIIATSDADSYWDKEALLNSVYYFGARCVGAITGREKITNLEKSVHTLSEGVYLRFYHNLRLGESKIHSTYIFNGGLSMYRKDTFEKFEDRPGYSDDVGTAITMISNGYRCIFVPDAIFNDTAAHSLTGRLRLKSRRAQHLIAGIIQSIRLKFSGKFCLPWSVVFFNFYLHVLSPLIAFSVLFVGAVIFIVYFQVLWVFPLLLLITLFFKKPRLFAVSYLTSNIALIIGIAHHFSKRRSTWRKIEEMRIE